MALGLQMREQWWLVNGIDGVCGAGEADVLVRGTAPVPRVEPCLSAALAGTPIDQREQIPLELEPQLRLEVHDWRGAETEGSSAHV